MSLGRGSNRGKGIAPERFVFYLLRSCKFSTFPISSDILTIFKDIFKENYKEFIKVGILKSSGK